MLIKGTPGHKNYGPHNQPITFLLGILGREKIRSALHMMSSSCSRRKKKKKKKNPSSLFFLTGRADRSCSQRCIHVYLTSSGSWADEFESPVLPHTARDHPRRTGGFGATAKSGEGYCQTYTIRHTKSKNLNVSHLVWQSPLPNPLKPGVKSRMKM